MEMEHGGCDTVQWCVCIGSYTNTSTGIQLASSLVVSLYVSEYRCYGLTTL
jgi:hypothetical protein